jgi:hypothetical protein
MKAMKTMIYSLWIILGGCFFLVLFLFLWNLERKINYSISYSSMVQHQIDRSLDEHVKKYHSQK